MNQEVVMEERRERKGKERKGREEKEMNGRAEKIYTPSMACEVLLFLQTGPRFSPSMNSVQRARVYSSPVQWKVVMM